MVTVIVNLSRYLILILMLLYTLQCFSVFGRKTDEAKRNVMRKQIVSMLFMDFVAFLVMYLQTEDVWMAYGCAAVMGYIIAVQVLYRIFYPKASLLLVNNMCMLLSIGFIILARLDMDQARKQYLIAVAGTLVSLAVPVIIRKVRSLKNLTWLYAVAGIGMLGVVLVLATVSRGAKLSIEIGGVTFQLSEVVKITFVFFIAGILRADTSFKNVVVATVVSAAHVLILVASRDLGSALVFFVAYLVMIYVATKKLRYAAAGLAGGCVAAVGAYYLFSHVRQRVITWKDPFAVYNEVGGGYQVAQSLFAVGAGGWFGMGLFEGTPEKIPIAEKDFVFAAICEELGGLFCICMLLVCMSCFLMIINISMRMNNRFYKLIALGLGAEYAFQVFLTVGGSINFIPLTGITLPLVAYGGSSVIATILVFAIIQGLYILREDEGEQIEKQKHKKDKPKKPGKPGRGNRRKEEREEYGEKTLEEKIREQTEKSLNW